MKCAVDFETYYDDEYSLRKMSAQQYCRDPRFNAYCVSIAREDGLKYCGDPKGFDWNLIRGCDIWMHNAGFDGLVMKRLQRDGIIPADIEINPYCTADMSAFLQAGRSLAAASKNLLGKELKKDTRDRMKGKILSDCGEELRTELLHYCQQDADSCLDLAVTWSPKWPEIEQEASRLSRRKGWQGLPLDVEYLKYSKAHLDELVHGYLSSIPWYPSEKPLSVSAMRAEARKCGIPWFPASLDKRDVKADEWFTEFGPKYPWVLAVRNFRSANTLLNRVTTLWNGRVDGVFPFDLLYFGAGTTGRWSGGGLVFRRRGARGSEEKAGTFNPQNMPRDAMYGVDLRYCIMAPDGKLFYIADYNQIECRLLLWRAKARKMLDLIASGVHPYIAYAIQNLGAPSDMDKKHPLYPLAKACVLGCGYQAGGKAFKRAAKALAGLDLTEDDAIAAVRAYRASNPEIVQYWARHQMFLEFSVNAGDKTHEVELASGRTLQYFNPHNGGLNDWGRPQIEVQYGMGEEPDHIYGGLLTENEIQATARDVLRDGWVALDKAGFDVPLTVHDEYVMVGPADGGKDYIRAATEVLSESSPWAEGCPLTLSFAVSDHYEK